MLEEKGVEFHLNAGVNEIVLEEGKVRGREGGRGGREAAGGVKNKYGFIPR